MPTKLLSLAFADDTYIAEKDKNLKIITETMNTELEKSINVILQISLLWILKNKCDIIFEFKKCPTIVVLILSLEVQKLR